MKKIISVKKIICTALALSMISSQAVFAEIGEKSVFGGISQGVPLPKITAPADKKKTKIEHTQVYEEMIFLSGKPQKFVGLVTMTQSAVADIEKDSGTFKLEYVIEPDPNIIPEENAPVLNKEIEFKVNYRTVKDSGTRQIIYDYQVESWTASVSVGGSAYTLVPEKSTYSRSVIKDLAPGINYYKGFVSSTETYLGESSVVVQTSGPIYGYDCAWSKTETDRLNVVVLNGKEGAAGSWQLEAQIRPSVSVNKVIQYSPNEPTAISFDGNYYEVTNSNSALAYNLYTVPKAFEKGTETQGSFAIPGTASVEMLPAPDLAFLKGHFAEDDIKKLFALQVYDGDPKQFQPAQAMTRAQFVTGLVKALKIPVEEPTTSKTKKTVTTVLFPDVQSNRPDFKYLMAAYNTGIVYGRYSAASDNKFRPDDAITMEEAVTILMRGLGLENLGLEPTTVTLFADDAKIANWAKKEVAAAQKVGIIDMDANGNLNPKKQLTKAEGAAILNSAIDYMRTGLPVDYQEHILNFAD